MLLLLLLFVFVVVSETLLLLLLLLFILIIVESATLAIFLYNMCVCVCTVRQCSIQSFYLNKDKLNWVTGTDNFLIYSLLYIYLYPTGVVYFTSYIIVIFSNIYIFCYYYLLHATCQHTHHATKAGRKRENIPR